MLCEYCNIEITSNYGSGRFCSSKCARGFSTKSKRLEINEKMSRITTENHYSNPEFTIKCEFCNRLHSGKFGSGRFCNRTCSSSFCASKAAKISFDKVKNLSLSEETKQKIKEGQLKGSARFQLIKKLEALNKPFEQRSYKMRFSLLFEKQEGKCFICNNSEWLGEPITLEYDHIDGNNSNNTEENARLLCPNCHSKTDTWKGRNFSSKKKLPVSDSELIEALKTSTKISKALKKVNLNPKGLNYVRCYRLIYENNIETLIK